jgi:hypothetical protein
VRELKSHGRDVKHKTYLALQLKKEQRCTPTPALGLGGYLCGRNLILFCFRFTINNTLTQTVTNSTTRIDTVTLLQNITFYVQALNLCMGSGGGAPLFKLETTCRSVVYRKSDVSSVQFLTQTGTS